MAQPIVMSRKKEKNKDGSSASLLREWQTWYAGKSPILIFGLKFGLLMVLLYVLLCLPFFDLMLGRYLEANAWLSNAILNVFGQHSHISADEFKLYDVISSPTFGMRIRRGCDAVEPTWLFCAAIAAFPAPWRSKLMGMLVGIIVLQLLNLVRIVTLYFIGVHFNSIFETVHVEIWPTAFIIVAILLWVSWMEWTKRPHA